MYLNTKDPTFRICKPEVPEDLDAGIRIASEAFGRPWTLGQLQGYLRMSTVSSFVAKYHCRVVGFLLLEQRADHLYIALIATAPEFQGRGVGSHMLAWVSEHAKDFNRAVVRLTCHANDEAANRFYRRNCYVEVARLQHEYGRDHHGVLYQLAARRSTPGVRASRPL